MTAGRSARWLAWAVALVIASVLVWARFASDGIREAGDGVQHHMIARYSWKHPALLLDQWGKPMFTLLASPFAHFGYNAMTLFNALAALAAVALAMRPLKRSGGWTMVAFPAALMLAPQYAQLIIDGMTEILFGSMALFAVCLLLDGRPRAAAAVASLTPLCRPEYVVVLPLVAGWLLWKRQYRAVPLCALGIGIYSFFGLLHTGDPFSWWHGDPYGSGPSIYGKGDPWLFLLDAPRAFGWPLIAAFALALALWPVIQHTDVEERGAHRLLFVTAAGGALGIVAVHAYLRWSGTHGSAGLTRVLVTAAPLAALFALFTLGRGLRLVAGSRVIGLLAVLVIGAGGVSELRASGPLVQGADDDQVAINAACARIAEVRKPGDRVFTTHPYVPFKVGLDGFNDEESLMLWGFRDDDEGPTRAGDIIFWESALGPNECGVELGTILDNRAFTVLDIEVPEHGHFVFGGRTYEVWVFQRYPGERIRVRDTLGTGDLSAWRPRLDTVHCPDGGPGWCSNKEFPMAAERLPLPKQGSLFEDWVVELDIRYLEEGSEAMVIFKRNRGDELMRYDEFALHEGANRFLFRLPADNLDVDQNLYIYAPGRRMMRCTDLRITRERVRQERIPTLPRK